MTSRDQPLATEQFRVAMADTDAAGLIYYGAPLRWAERMTTGWMREIGLSSTEILASGYGLPAVHAEVFYRAPLRLDDDVDASLWFEKRSTRTLTLRSRFALAGEDAAVEVLLTQVYARVLDGEVRAQPLPGPLESGLRR